MKSMKPLAPVLAVLLGLAPLYYMWQDMRELDLINDLVVPVDVTEAECLRIYAESWADPAEVELANQIVEGSLEKFFLAGCLHGYVLMIDKIRERRGWKR